jgi:hypothetical protein
MFSSVGDAPHPLDHARRIPLGQVSLGNRLVLFVVGLTAIAALLRETGSNGKR